jgi:hypothetical protein
MPHPPEVPAPSGPGSSGPRLDPPRLASGDDLTLAAQAHAEALFWRLVRSAARDARAFAQFTATLGDYSLPVEQRNTFLRRFAAAAMEDEASQEPPPPRP